MEDIPKSQLNTKTFVSKNTFTISHHNKSGKTVLSVKFPDGKIISDRFALQTLISCIRTIGFERVQQLGIMCCGVPLVANKKDDFYRQDEVKPGLYIMTHSATQTKKQQLDEISQRLKLGLKVEII